jgi:hypothetical protein
VLKRIPSETLKDGGRFVVVASGLTNGKGIKDRLEVLHDEAYKAGLPTNKIEVIGSDGLRIWCNRNPAVAAKHAGHPSGLWSLSDWSSIRAHQGAWQSTPEIDPIIDSYRRDLDFASGTIFHLHIQGPPGVGKTRFALELCRNAGWSDIIYFRDALNDSRLIPLVDEATAAANERMLVVTEKGARSYALKKP